MNIDTEILRNALAEDIGAGDLTSTHFVDADTVALARVVAREECVVAGAQLAAGAFRMLDPGAVITIHLPDGSKAGRGACILDVRAAARAILSAERVALNFAQRLSGIATLTRNYVDAVAGTGAVILDTRKTTPGLRALEKHAVTCGGGRNHRMGLYDAVMLKDNHLPLSGGLDGLRSRLGAFKAAHPNVMVELEADTPDQVRAFLDLSEVDVILLDNMTLEEMTECVQMRGSRSVKLEASGGVTLERVRAIATTGVDFISIGALTHSARAVDLSLEIEPLEA